MVTWLKEGDPGLGKISGARAASVLCLIVSPALASESGNGVYALDCDGGEVEIGGSSTWTCRPPRTNSSDRPPHDFLVALLYGREGSPIAPSADGDPHIEIWQGLGAYDSLSAAREMRRLAYCQGERVLILGRR